MAYFCLLPLFVIEISKTEIKLTESLAAPLIESTRREYEKRLAEKNADIAKREQSIREREEAVKKARETINDEVAAKLRQERARIAAEEANKAKLALGIDLEQKANEIVELKEVLK